jgi:hypothetical protein
MKRRTFIAGLGSAAAWPIAAGAQQGERMRRIGVLMSRDENDPLYKSRLSAFTQALADLGWTDGRNVRMDLRWGGGDADRMPAAVQELVGLQPNIILAESTVATVAVQRENRDFRARLHAASSANRSNHFHQDRYVYERDRGASCYARDQHGGMLRQIRSPLN